MSSVDEDSQVTAIIEFSANSIISVSFKLCVKITNINSLF